MDILKFKIFESETITKEYLEDYILDAVENGFNFTINYGFSHDQKIFAVYPSSKNSIYVANINFRLPEDKLLNVDKVLQWSDYLSRILKRIKSFHNDSYMIRNDYGFSMIIPLSEGIPESYWDGIAKTISKRFLNLDSINRTLKSFYKNLEKVVKIDYDIIDDVLIFTTDRKLLSKYIYPDRKRLFSEYLLEFIDDLYSIGGQYQFFHYCEEFRRYTVEEDGDIARIIVKPCIKD